MSYETTQASVAIRGAANLEIRSLMDRQQYADPHGDAAAAGFSTANWSLFGVIWPSGLQLAALMASRPLVPHERILEVGCGLALASLVCHRRGADVTASDAHPMALHFLADNVLLNDLPPLPYRHGNWASDTDEAVHSDHPIVQGRFDLIIGSDILYERDDAGHLAAFIARHAMPASEVWIVDPNRGNRPAFHRRMHALGFDLTETTLNTPEADNVPYRGRLLKYKRTQFAARAA